MAGLQAPRGNDGIITDALKDTYTRSSTKIALCPMQRRIQFPGDEVDTIAGASQSSSRTTQMHLFPASLLVTAVVLMPNVLYAAFPPLNLQKYGSPKDSRLLTSVERLGQTSSFILPISFGLSYAGTLVLLAWAIMGISLATYSPGGFATSRAGGIMHSFSDR